MTLTQDIFDLTGKTAAITGGAGVLCSAIARMLAGQGANVAILDLNAVASEALAAELGPNAIGIGTNVLERASVEAAAAQVIERFSGVDILINGAGGNKVQATTSADLAFFDLPPDAIQWVFNLNILGTIIPSQVFGGTMAQQNSGVILNISSMSADRPLSRIVAYSVAKAGVSNFTQWLAVHMAQEYTPNIRVNALAPGFFLTTQNRFLLIDEQTGEFTERGRQVLANTPSGRFGDPDDLLGAVLWLISPAASFVTGIVLPIDGGFSAYSGV